MSTIVSVVSLFAYLGLAALVIRHDVRPRANRIFLLYLAAMVYWQLNALMVSLSNNAAMATFWYQMMLTGGIFAVLYFHFTIAYLHVGGRTESALLNLGYFVAILLGLLTMAFPDLAIASVHRVATGLYVPEFAPLMYVQGLFVYFYLGLGMAELVVQYRKTTSELLRDGLRYLILGVSIVFVGALSNFLSILQGYPVDIIANLANAVLIAYAILRYQLLDIAIVVRKGLLYSVPTAVLGAAYFLTVYLVVDLFHFVTGYQVLLISLGMAALTAVAVQPLWTRMQAWVDRLFFREKYDARMMLQRLSRTATSVLDLSGLTTLILDEIAQTMHSEPLSFFLRHEETGDLRLMAQIGLEGGYSPKFSEDHPLVKWESTHEGVLTRTEVDVLPHFRAMWLEERKDLERLKADLFVPLRVRGELVGILVLGPKRSEEPYSQDERLTLSTLANQTAVAVQNAWLYSLEQRKVEESHALLDIAKAVSSTLQLGKMLEIVARRTAEICGVDRCSVLLRDDERDRLLPLMSQFADGAKDAGLWHTFQAEMYIEDVHGVPLLHRILSDRQPVIVTAGSMKRLPARWVEPFGIKSLLAVPLVSKDRAIGLLVLDHVQDARGFTDEQVNLAMTIGTQVTIAIENARLYEETSEDKERIETLVEQAFSGIMVIDPEMRVLTLNPEVEAISGYSASELVGRRLDEVFEPDLWAEGSLVATVMATGGRVDPAETRLASKNKARDVLLGVTPIHDGYLLNFADITRLKEVDRLKSSIVANVSHELRAPLASIKAYTELLLDNLDGGDRALRHRFLSIIDQETDWLSELISDLLDLSRLESEQFAPRMDSLSLTEIMDGVVDILQVQMQERDIVLNVDMPLGLPAIDGDKELMTILFKNLLSNAIKFSPEGARVDVEARALQNRLVFDIIDRGMGIPPEDLPRLFTKFYRSRLAKDSGIRGTGLGLVLVKETVDLHEGSIEVDSKVGVGTRFTVTLPLERAHAHQQLSMES
jgi:PAS domain S-box-containing protein